MKEYRVAVMDCETGGKFHDQKQKIEFDYETKIYSTEEELFAGLQEQKVELILLFAGEDKEVCRKVLQKICLDRNLCKTAVAVITEDQSASLELDFLGLGAQEVIPAGSIELMALRIRNLFEQIHLKEEVEGFRDEREGYVELFLLQAIFMVTRTIDSVDDENGEGSIRVARYAALMAKELGWDEERIRNIYYLGLVHDIGKISVPDIIMSKPEKLSQSEWRIIQEHTTKGADLLKDLHMVKMASEIALSHHEWYNGNGYPLGMSGENIPIESRIIAIADAYDSMKRKHVYRNPLMEEEVARELADGKGTQFDPKLVDLFLKMLAEKKMTADRPLPFLQITDRQESTALEESGNLFFKIMEMNKKEAMKDSLTGLYNRSYAESYVTKSLSRNQCGVFIMIDMDNFKHINDHYGHMAGDNALRHVAELLYDEVGDKGIVCRLGGDEFLLFLFHSVDKVEIEKWVQSLLVKYRKIAFEQDQMMGTSLSAGIAIAMKDGVTYKDLYKASDKALYHSKKKGKNGYSFYEKELDERENIQEEHAPISKLASLIRDPWDKGGSYQVDYTEFQRIYNYIVRSAERTGVRSELVVLSLIGDRNNKEYLLLLEEAMKGLEEAVTVSLRKNDVYARYSGFQLMVALTHIAEDHTDAVLQRISNNFYQIYKDGKFTLAYDKMQVQNQVSDR